MVSVPLSLPPLRGDMQLELVGFSAKLVFLVFELEFLVVVMLSVGFAIILILPALV